MHRALLLVLGCAAINYVLRSVPLPVDAPDGARLQWPDGEGTMPGDRSLDLCDERNWTSGVHGGWRPIREGRVRVEEKPA